ncbi:hypothetical protein OIU84_025390 [Salix udensis]|uniref:Uncharacterized protein n=1 Tax=Salix udensis TaxID=889485 RepID=A0AAD6KJG3_9ROSI|nr:hypothetical protein OIU84_025390 [Salix udensis]
MNCRGGQKERVILTLPGETLTSQTPLLICKQWIPVEGNIIHEQPIFGDVLFWNEESREQKEWSKNCAGVYILDFASSSVLIISIANSRAFSCNGIWNPNLVKVFSSDSRLPLCTTDAKGIDSRGVSFFAYVSWIAGPV